MFTMFMVFIILHGSCSYFFQFVFHVLFFFRNDVVSVWSQAARVNETNPYKCTVRGNLREEQDCKSGEPFWPERLWVCQVESQMDFSLFRESRAQEEVQVRWFSLIHLAHSCRSHWAKGPQDITRWPLLCIASTCCIGCWVLGQVFDSGYLFYMFIYVHHFRLCLATGVLSACVLWHANMPLSSVPQVFGHDLLEKEEAPPLLYRYRMILWYGDFPKCWYPQMNGL